MFSVIDFVENAINLNEASWKLQSSKIKKNIFKKLQELPFANF